MIGCERSLQFHRHFYGDEPPRVEMCPRRIAGERNEPTLAEMLPVGDAYRTG